MLKIYICRYIKIITISCHEIFLFIFFMSNSEKTIACHCFKVAQLHPHNEGKYLFKAEPLVVLKISNNKYCHIFTQRKYKMKNTEREKKKESTILFHIMSPILLKYSIYKCEQFNRFGPLDVIYGQI